MANPSFSACCALMLAVGLATGSHAADPKTTAAKAAVAADVQEAPSAAAKDIGLTLLNKGSDKDWQHYMLDDAAVHVSAASLVGIAPSAVPIAESTRDFGLLVQAVDPKNKGGGVAITPARASHPFPRVNLADYLKSPRRWQPLVNLTLSYAQSTSEVEGIDYRRRAVAISTNGTFRDRDDPVWVRVKAMDCADSTITKELEEAAKPSGPLKPDASASDPKTVKLPKVAEKLEECVAAESKQFDERWFRPIWSVTLATGDVRLDQTGSSSVRLGESVVVAARYGAPIAKSTDGSPTTMDKASFDWGWAVSASAKYARREPVLASVGTADVQRQNTSVIGLRAAAGTDTVRVLAEGSNVKVRAVQGGEQSLKRALGIDYRITSGWWLNFRYGRREKASGAGDESAGLLTLTVSPSALKLN